MERVFISSLFRGEMAAIRQTVRTAVDSLDMRPVMFESEPARDEASRRALLSQVAESDVLVLLLGAEYGEPVARGVSPTEEEFNEAGERGIPVLALVQRLDREPAQEEFVDRVRGGWEQVLFAPEFTDASDVGFAAVRALNAWRQQSAGGDTAAAAKARALELARGREHSGVSYGGSKLRVVAVPAINRHAAGRGHDPRPRARRRPGRCRTLQPAGAAQCGDQGLRRRRQHRVVAERRPRLRAAHAPDRVRRQRRRRGSRRRRRARLRRHAGHGRPCAREVMERAVAFAEAVWSRIDSRDEVRDVFLACAVPEANHKVYALEPAAGSLSMGMGGPHVLVAPEPPLAARRADLPAAVERLQAELHRSFELLGAVHARADRSGF